VKTSSLLSLTMLGAAFVWACSGDDPSTSELTAANGSSSSVASSSATGGGKALPCGPNKTCASACCLVTNDAGIYCSGSPSQCPSTALVKTECDGPSDCAQGQVCCGVHGTAFVTYCRAYCNDGEEQFCNAQGDCPAGTCNDVTWNGPTGYTSCQP